MFKHYFKIAFRSIIKDKGYSLVNVTGLAIAIACCFLLIFWVKFELSYEKCFPDSESIYRILIEENRNDGKYYETSIRPGISDRLKESFPQIEAATFYHNEKVPFSRLDMDSSEGVLLSFLTTNSDYLKIFALNYVEGNPRRVINNNGVVITTEAAKKLFGNESPMGKKLSLFNDFSIVTIEAVVELPHNTDIRFDVMAPVDPIVNYGVHYIKLKNNSSVNQAFLKQLADFHLVHAKPGSKLRLQPIERMHLESPRGAAIGNTGKLNQIYLFSIAAILILIVAIINYINTSVARALNRMKEVGVRKVTGSNKKQLVIRFLSESFLLSIISVFLALVLTKLLFTDFSAIMGYRVDFGFDLTSILIAILVCIVVTLLSGGYAAFYLSRLNPMLVLRGGSKTGSKENLRKILIGFQFFLSISILICTFIIYKQLNSMFNAETGVERDNVVIIDSSLWYDAENFIQIIKKENLNIIDASIASVPPYNATWGYSGVSWEGSPEHIKEMEFNQIYCDHHYANTFGLKIIEGEFIPPGLTWWQYSEEKSFHIVINETFKKIMGVDSPLGITVEYAHNMRGKIIGVVKDFNFKPLKEKISPLIISFNPEGSTQLFIRTTGHDKKATLEYILGKYKEMKPNYSKQPIIYRTVEEDFNKMYETELRTGKILTVFSAISFFLSLMGVISMISFMIEKRTKEIAIRKINGAHLKDIVLLFNRDIIKLGLIATILSIPICYLLMNQWLQNYIYRTSLSWWIFVLIPAMVIVVTSIVISVQIYLTTRQNPVKSLRNE